MKPLLWIAVLLSWSSVAQADCNLAIAAGNITIDWTLNYTIKSFTFTVTRAAAPVSNCVYGIGFTKGTATDYTTRRAINGLNAANYQLYPDTTKANILKDKPAILSSNDVIMDNYADGIAGQHTLTYYVDIPYVDATSPRLLASGDFVETYTLNVYEGADPTLWGAPITSAAVTLTIRVPKIIALSLVDPGGTFDDAKTIKNSNFGLLSPGQAVAMDVRIRSNAGYQVTFQSLRSANLKHLTANSLVPYKLYVNSEWVDVSGGGAVQGLDISGQTGLGGQGYAIRAVIQPFLGAGRLAGSYSDQITVTAITKE